MSVLDRAALEESPLADLHALASELSIDGYRRLRRPELIAAILRKQEGVEETEPEEGSGADGEEPIAADAHAPEAGADVEVDEASADVAHADEAHADEAHADEAHADEAHADEAHADETEPPADDPAEERPAARRRRGRRGGRGRPNSRDDSPREDSSQREEDGEEEEATETVEEDQVVEGVVELLGNGSGFIRVDPPEPSDDDVYISAAQVKRCELVSGDRIAGPRRTPRRSERFASLIRIDTINGRPAAELADSVRFDDLPAAFPADRFRLGSEDPTVKAIEWLTPFGKGSRVTIVGPARSGKTEALRRLTSALVGQDQLEVIVVLAGVRPEEITEWSNGPQAPAAAVSFAASPEAQGNTIEPVIDQARRLAARGGDVVVLIDTLDGLPPHAARKTLAAARNIVDGGSLTLIATASEPVGGETTVIALDAALASTGRFPAVDLVASGTLRPELLVGEAGAEAIARARADAGDAS